MKPAKVVKDALEKAVEKVAGLVNPPVPGPPASQPPELDVPTQPREPLPPKADQAAALGQQAEYLTTAQGVRLYDTDHSLKAGDRGPVLLQDHHLREKVMHFDHKRIPERPSVHHALTPLG